MHRSRLLAGATAHGEEPTQQQVLSGTAIHGGTVREQLYPAGL